MDILSSIPLLSTDNCCKLACIQTCISVCIPECVHGDASFHQGHCDDGSMQCPHPIKSYLGHARVSQNKIKKGPWDLEY